MNIHYFFNLQYNTPLPSSYHRHHHQHHTYIKFNKPLKRKRVLYIIKDVLKKKIYSNFSFILWFISPSHFFFFNFVSTFLFFFFFNSNTKNNNNKNKTGILHLSKQVELNKIQNNIRTRGWREKKSVRMFSIL